MTLRPTRVVGVNHDHGPNICRPKWFDESLLHLALKQHVYDVWIGLEERDERGSDAWVLV